MNPPRRRTHRFAKPINRLLSELEDHLHLLRTHLSAMSGDAAHLRPLTTELRLLICQSSGTSGLLYRMADQLSVSDEVYLHMHGGIDPDHPLARGMRFGQSLPARPSTPQADQYKSRFPAESIRLRDVISKQEALFTLGKGVTFERVIKSVAEQIGSAHADDGIEPTLAAIEEAGNFIGTPPYFPTVRFAAGLTLEVGERVLASAERSGDFARRRFSPPVTLFVNVVLRDKPLNPLLLASARSHISHLTVEIQLRPQGFLVNVKTEGNAGTEIWLIRKVLQHNTGRRCHA